MVAQGDTPPPLDPLLEALHERHLEMRREYEASLREVAALAERMLETMRREIDQLEEKGNTEDHAGN